MKKTCKYCGQEIVFVKNELNRKWVAVQPDSLSDGERKMINEVTIIRKKYHKIHQSYCQSNVYKLKKEVRKRKQQLRRQRKRELYKYYAAELQRLGSGAPSAAANDEHETKLTQADMKARIAEKRSELFKRLSFELNSPEVLDAKA